MRQNWLDNRLSREAGGERRQPQFVRKLIVGLDLASDFPARVVRGVDVDIRIAALKDANGAGKVAGI
jgi:hypothetical protein